MTDETEVKPKAKRGRKPKEKVADVQPTVEKSAEDKAFDQPHHGHADETVTEKPADVVAAVNLTIDPATFLKIGQALGVKSKPVEEEKAPEDKPEVVEPTKPEPKIEKHKTIAPAPVAKASDDILRKAAEKEAARLAWYRGGRRK